MGAIVQDYVATREPVGSQSVARRHQLGVSAATIRADMAALEAAGLISAPHTSAGRIPTDAGYRAFVDSISTLKPLSAPQRAAIEKILERAVDLDDVLTRAVRLLAQITHQVAAVQYPSLRAVSLRHVEVVPTAPGRALLVIITDAGRVEQRTIDLGDGTGAPTGESSGLEQLSDTDLARLRDALNRELNGVALGAMGDARVRIENGLDRRLAPIALKIASVIEEVLSAEVEERVVVAGTGNLSRNRGDFDRTMVPVLDLLEEQVLLLRMLAGAEIGSGDQSVREGSLGVKERELAVHIGHENEQLALSQSSVVSTDYGDAQGRIALGRIGVLGPTRMDYPSAMSSVAAVAQYLSEIFHS